MPENASTAAAAGARHVCVVGSGPAGMVLALELARLGCLVTLVESGLREADAEAQALSNASFGEPDTHAPMADAVQRRFGGTSHLWGGRCVPFDPLDFEARPGLRDGWPIGFDEMAAHYARACEYADCGPPIFRLQPACGSTPAAPISERFVDGSIRSDHLERWCASAVLVDRLGPLLEQHSRIRRQLGKTCLGLATRDAGRTIVGVRLADTRTAAAEPEVLAADVVVLACGGVETTRLLLNCLAQPDPPRIDGHAWLGRGYMGHLSGKIATLRLAGDPRQTVHDFEQVGGRYLRRRFTLTDEALRDRGLLNIAMWLDNPPPADAAHGSGVLSIAYLAMRTPVLGARLAPNAIRQSLLKTGRGGQPWRHLVNVVRRLPSTIAFATRFVRARYLAFPRLPGFFAYSPANVYALHFHAEQTPNDASRIELDPVETDALGLPRARLSLRFNRQDAESVVAAHAAFDAHLREHRIGELDYRFPAAERVDAVLRQARDGFHQIGSARMAGEARAGVVDRHGRVFGTTNLFVCSSAVFPTSSQANPTLTIMAFAVRQAAHLAVAVEPAAAERA